MKKVVLDTNVLLVSISKRSKLHWVFRALLDDEDDNKFVDCAIAANASFVVSHDTDFNMLRSIDFPSVNVINTKSFRKVLNL